MSKPKPVLSTFTFADGDDFVSVSYHFDAKGKPDFVLVMRGQNEINIERQPGANKRSLRSDKKSIRIDNRRGEYKPRVTDAMRLIEQTANGASPVYGGRQRASRAAKRQSEVGRKLKQAFRIFGVGE